MCYFPLVRPIYSRRLFLQLLICFLLASRTHVSVYEDPYEETIRKNGLTVVAVFFVKECPFEVNTPKDSPPLARNTCDPGHDPATVAICQFCIVPLTGIVIHRVFTFRTQAHSHKHIRRNKQRKPTKVDQFYLEPPNWYLSPPNFVSLSIEFSSFV